MKKIFEKVKNDDLNHGDTLLIKGENNLLIVEVNISDNIIMYNSIYSINGSVICGTIIEKDIICFINEGDKIEISHNKDYTFIKEYNEVKGDSFSKSSIDVFNIKINNINYEVEIGNILKNKKG